jgi:hypothetical protein
MFLVLHTLKSLTLLVNKLNDLASQMRLCEPFPSNVSVWDDIYQTALQQYSLASQFNYERPNPAIFNVSRPLFVLLNQTVAANSTGEVLRIPLQMQTLRTPDQCLLWNNTINTGAAAGIQDIPWDHVQCFSLPADVSGIPEGAIFPPRKSNEGQIAQCKSLNQSTAFAELTNEEIVKRYKFTQEDLVAAKRILFTQAGFDPTTSVGPPDLPLNADIDATRTLIMPGNGHGEETFPSILENTEPVQAVRRFLPSLHIIS